jgi:hypothetical protein
MTFDPQNRNLCAYTCAQEVYINHHIPVFVLPDWLCDYVRDLTVLMHIDLN